MLAVGMGAQPHTGSPPAQSLQAKQSTLLQQLDSLDRELEEMQASLGEAEEDKARLAEQLEQSQQQSGKQLQEQQELLDTLQQEKQSLEQSILELQANTSQLQEQAQELRERERLLVFFPDLHTPTETQFESSGNLTEDMKSQLQANKIRIEVLERENTQLEALLAKVKAAAEQGVLKVSWVPQNHPTAPRYPLGTLGGPSPSSSCSPGSAGQRPPAPGLASSAGTAGTRSGDSRAVSPTSSCPAAGGTQHISAMVKCHKGPQRGQKLSPSTDQDPQIWPGDSPGDTPVGL
uniref:Uncharacterized protein n=1 Tax=Junco hyemalis TaxID=40217 RepID=A0A8C5JST2_JUNHY